MIQNSPQVFEFSVFKFDATSGELWRNGRKLRVSEQAARVLAILLEHAGAVVTRDSLRQLLWPTGELVDYDHSINNAISQLRFLLRDDSKPPRFIETIPKRGYRFIGTITPPLETAHQDREQISAAASASVAAPIAVDRFISSTEAPDNIGSTAVLQPVPRLGPAARQAKKIVLAVTCVVVLVVAGIVIGRHYRQQQSVAAYMYVGIAPFEFTGEGSGELADSFRMDLTDALSQLPGVRIRATHSFANQKQDDTNLRTLAQKLSLDTILLGNFTLQGNQFALQLELVRGRDASHLASFRYSGTKDQLSTIRDRAQRDIFARLELKGEANRPAPGSTANPSAYEAYLRGRYYLSQWRDESLNRAVQEFESAIAKDAGFAKAYAGLASTYMLMADHAVTAPEESYSKAGELATKAAQMDPSLAEAHSMIGYVALHKDWNFALAERELRQAVDLDPGQAIYHLWLAQLFTLQGRFDEGLQQVDLAHAADPFWAPVYVTEIYTAYAARQVPRAMNSAQKLTELMPDWPLAHGQRGWLFWYSGHYPEAIADWRQMAVMENDTARISLEDRGLEAFRRGGIRAYARLRLDAINTRTKWAHALTDFNPAEWYVYAGEHEKALTALEELVNRRDLAALQMSVNPAYTDLYSYPRFHALLGRVGLKLPNLKATSQTASK